MTSNRNLIQLIALLVFQIITAQCQRINPSILQDSRVFPKVDGTFGFMYKTEDGIEHSAKADPGGTIHGRFSYTDPTGLKVNYNYYAGSQVTPKYNYQAAPYQQQTQPQSQIQRQPTQPQSQIQRQPQAQPTYNNYDNQGPIYQPQAVPERRTRPQHLLQNNNQANNYQQDQQQQDNGQYDYNDQNQNYDLNTNAVNTNNVYQ